MLCFSFTVPVAPPLSATSSRTALHSCREGGAEGGRVPSTREEGNADVFVSLTLFTHHKQLPSPKFSQTPADGQSSTAPPIQSAATKGAFVFAVPFLFNFLEIILPRRQSNVPITVSLERRKVGGNKRATERLLGSLPD